MSTAQVIIEGASFTIEYVAENRFKITSKGMMLDDLGKTRSLEPGTSITIMMPPVIQEREII